MADEKLGRYRLLKLIATGGMGEVFLARQEGPAGFSKTVVVKRILRHLARDQGFIDLFLNEAQLAAQLQHPSIVQVFGLEREDETWFMSMEYVPGKSLRSLIEACKRKKMTIPLAISVRLISQVLQGLEFAHELKDDRGRRLGILHRDVSPENVLVASSGMAKLADFGIARAMRGAETRVGRPKGKLAYMAPEAMVSGAPIDRRADVYGAGVVLHELATLDRPPLGKVGAEGVPDPVSYTPPDSLPDSLKEALRRALAFDAKDRWPSAHAMSEALEGWLTSSGHTVLAADIATFLHSVHGETPAPMSALLGDEVGNSGLIPILGTSMIGGNTPPSQLGGTGGTDPVLRAVSAPTAQMNPELLTQFHPTPNPIVTTQDPRPELKPGPWLLLAGLTTAIVFLTVTILAIVSAQNRRNQRSVEPPDAGGSVLLLPVPPPVEPEPIDAGAEEPDAGPGDEELVTDGGIERPGPRKRRGKVDLRVKPWAVVFLGGKKLGTTPLSAPVDVPAGPVTFVLKNPQEGTKRVTKYVPAGKTVLLVVDMTK